MRADRPLSKADLILADALGQILAEAKAQFLAEARRDFDEMRKLAVAEMKAAFAQAVLEARGAAAAITKLTAIAGGRQ